MPGNPLQPVPPEAVRAFLEGSEALVLLQLDRDGAVVGFNERARDLFGLEEERTVTVRELVVVHAVPKVQEILGGAEASGPMLMDFLDPSRHPFTLRCWFMPAGETVHVFAEAHQAGDEALNRTLVSVNQELAVLSRENARRVRELAEAKAALEQAHEELRTTHWHLRKVQEVISVCMNCGSVNADEDVWQSMSAYFKDNEIFLSHGLCPSCARTMDAEVDEVFGQGDTP